MMVKTYVFEGVEAVVVMVTGMLFVVSVLGKFEMYGAKAALVDNIADIVGSFGETEMEITASPT